MKCPHCGSVNDQHAPACSACGSALQAGEADEQATVASTGPPQAPAPEADAEATVAATPAADTAATVASTPVADTDATVASTGPPQSPTPWSQPGVEVPTILTPSGTLPEGAVLGGRYSIDRILGVGGMGSVYCAYDNELDRPVALKLIRADLASNAMVLQRFKQEIILSREVTHPNVVRIFDLGTSDGLRYITMELVPGCDLKDVIVTRGKIPPEEAADMMIQICRALDAAHSAGVVHRDLKPQNIMVTEDGTAKVMDFGIARSMETTGMGMTGTGEMLGTPAYMSPEQAKGEPADERSDVFSLGLIFFEMLTGKLPFLAETAMGTLMKRIQEDAPPPKSIEPALPDWLNGVVVKCLERDPELRYAGAADILRDLEEHKAPPEVTMFDRVPARIRSMSPGGRRVAGVTLLAAMAVVVGGFFVIANWPEAGRDPGVVEAVIEPVGLAILPFRNASGDPSLDWLGSSLGEMLRTDIGQSAYLRTVPTDRVRQVVADLRLGANATFDPATLDRVANFSDARNLVTGQYLRVGEQIRIDATLHDLDGDRQIPLKVEAPSEEAILAAVSELAAMIRADLDLGSEAVAALEATAFSPSTDSLEALRRYNEGLQQERGSDYPGALAAYQASIAADAYFALAYSRLGLTYASLGRDGEAEEASRAAVDLSPSLGDYERRLIAAAHEVVMQDNDAAIDAYRALVEVAPADPGLRLALTALLEQAGNFAEARDVIGPALEADPSSVAGLYLLGRIETRSGDPQAAVAMLEEALAIVEEAGNDDGRGRMLNAIGFAYQFLNRSEEALEYLENALEVMRATDQKQGIAAVLSNRAGVKAVLGDLDEALANLTEALALQREIGDRSGVGTTLMNIGNHWADRGDGDQAIESYKEALQVQREVGNDVYAAVCLNNIGTVYYDRGEYSDARTYYEQAYTLRQGFGAPADLGQSLHNLGETQLFLGNYDEALDYLMQATEQWRTIGDDWGVAAESYDIGIIRGFQGRYAAALEAESDAAQVFIDLGSRDVWRLYTAGQLGIALGEIGRLDDAAVALQEALLLAEELQNGGLVAQAYEWQGQVRVMQGDLSGARSLFEQAQQAADDAGDARAALSARLRLAMVDVAAGGGAEEAAQTIAEMTDEARRMGLANAASEATLYRAQALIDAGDHDTARREIQTVQRAAERYSLNPLLARAHHLLGLVAAAQGDDVGRERQFAQARQLLDRIAADSGDEDPFVRADLNALRNDVSG